MTDKGGKQHSDYEVYRRRNKKPRNGDISQAKVKPAPPSPAKHNKKSRSAIEILDKKAKRLDESPPRTQFKKEKNADDVSHRKMKLSINGPDKSRSKNANNINEHKKQIRKKEKSNDKHRSPPENRKEKRKKIILQKVLGHQQDNAEADAAEPKSPKAIRVNKVKDWISPSHVYSKQPSSSSKKAPVDTIPNVKKEKVKLPRPSFKRLIRRPLWQLSKGVIKSNEHWSKLMEENMIDVDKINIDALDLSLIDIDAMGIENKLLKRTIAWLLK